MKSIFRLVVLAFLCSLAACGGGGTSPTPSPTPGGTAGGSASASPSSSAASTTATEAPFPSHTPWTSEPAGVLAFVDFREGKQEIFVKKMPDGAEVNVTNNPADDFDPDISQDGSKIAFASTRSGTTDIWTMNADGSNVTRLTSDNVGGQSPRWSRDGTQIAYSRGDGSIGVMNADGSNPRTIMVAQTETTADPCRAGAFVGGWSPDDSRITYYSASVTRSIGQVCTIAVDGSDIQVVVADPNAYDVEPVYSPDGTQIAFRGIYGGQHDIFVVDLATGVKHNLTHDADLDIEPDWSPDGQWIAYGSLRAGQPNFDLYIMRPDGSDVRRITSDPAKQSNPVWGP